MTKGAVSVGVMLECSLCFAAAVCSERYWQALARELISKRIDLGTGTMHTLLPTPPSSSLRPGDQAACRLVLLTSPHPLEFETLTLQTPHAVLSLGLSSEPLECCEQYKMALVSRNPQCHLDPPLLPSKPQQLVKTSRWWTKKQGLCGFDPCLGLQLPQRAIFLVFWSAQEDSEGL